MSDSVFRLSWEMAHNLRKYSNADPVLYKNTTQTVPNSQIPDEDWAPVSKLDTNPWAQFNALKADAESDQGFIRNVTLDELAVTETVVRRHYPASPLSSSPEIPDNSNPAQPVGGEVEWEYRCKLKSTDPDFEHEWVTVDADHVCGGTRERRVKAGPWIEVQP